MPGKLTIAFTISGLVQSRKMFWLNDIGSLGEPRNKKINRLSPLFHYIEKYSNGTFNPFTATESDQDRISPYIIDTVASRKVMRIKKNID